jgi:5'-nucleotidase
MRMLIDQDGVLADFDAKLFEDLAGVVDWPPRALAREARFCTDFVTRRERKIIRAYIEETDYFRHLPVIDGAKEGIAKLLELGHDLWVCTKPLEANKTCATDKMAWINEHFPELHDKVIIAPNKGLIKGDILLDDCIKEEWLGVAEWRPIHYSYPHNAMKPGLRFTWADDVRLLESYGGITYR